MKKTFYFLVAILALLTISVEFSNCAFAKNVLVKPNLNYVTKVISVGSFEAVSLTGNCDIVYAPSTSAQHLELYASDNVINLLDIYVKEGTLIVSTKKGYNIMRRNNDKMELRVSAPMVKKAQVTGSGDIVFTNDFSISSLKFEVTGSGTIQAENGHISELKLGVTGSGDITFTNVVTNHVKATVTGSGDIQISGDAQEAHYTVTGSGDINAINMKTHTVDTHVIGSGDISCYAIEKLKTNRTGSGSIRYKGNPEITTSKKNGIRRIED